MPKSTDKSQIEKFRDAARELETDQSEAAFEADVQKIAKAPKLSNEEIKELARRQRGGSKP
ncbi:hypothetical protein [Mesorhizobium sp.]|uniref:hypothetical protein n=1 Tax=Mesorhizobium sp. TaxID=1871066 RepID=UPI000FE90939|nr:hypothetical protein [Mesorhizobium sp.]RWE75954.1 MAG: hypothetical protein EOS42_12600 [Mesorhizobium sp.]TIV31403.1 MAG: hypothetical protein E5V90_07360 [Mesorhizobium sp.]